MKLKMIEQGYTEDELETFLAAQLVAENMLLSTKILIHKKEETSDGFSCNGVLSPYGRQPTELELAILWGFTPRNQSGECCIDSKGNFKIQIKFWEWQT